MTIDDFYAILALPESASLGARIYKKQVLENADLSSADRKLITDQLDTMEWRYAIKPANCAITRYDDDEREYGEIAVLHIVLKSYIKNTQLKRLGELLHRAIPYPLLLVFVATKTIATDLSSTAQETELLANATSSTLAICMADKRINRADSSKLTIFRTFDTAWLNLDELQVIEQDFLLDFAFPACNPQHLYSVYADLTRCIVALDIARHTGHYQRSASADADQKRQEVIQAMRQVESQLAGQYALLKAETQFNRQLGLNVQIKQLQQQMSEYTLQLKHKN